MWEIIGNSIAVATAIGLIIACIIGYNKMLKEKDNE